MLSLDTKVIFLINIIKHNDSIKYINPKFKLHKQN